MAEKQELEGLILTFYMQLKEATKQESKEGEEAKYWTEKFKKHFNIIHSRGSIIG